MWLSSTGGSPRRGSVCVHVITCVCACVHMYAYVCACACVEVVSAGFQGGRGL